MYYIYMMASKKHGTLYIGVTNDLKRRALEHKSALRKGFTEKYKISRLVYFDTCESIRSAIQREKQLKWWHRSWKIRLIEENNPDWRDLYYEI